MYCAMDLIDLCSFVERFAKYEVEEMRKMFEKFDEDNSGEISTDEMRKFMSALGFTPLRSSIAEALAAVDEDGSGSLNFEETVHLLEVYKSTEGFTQPEVQALYDSFMAEIRGQWKESDGPRPKPHESTVGIAAAKHFRGSGEADGTGWTLPAKRLCHVLLRHFGPASLEVATRLGREVLCGGGLSFAGTTSVKPENVEHLLTDDSVGAACQPLSFQEVLLWARRFREVTFADWREKFEVYDKDGSGSIDREELQLLIQDLGYTLHKDTMEEYVSLADEEWEGADKDGQLDYDEFVNFMLILREHEGFSAAEQRETENVFTKFDADGSGEIEVMELNDIFQYLGSVIRIEEVNKLLLKVDFNGSGSLDLREFRRLMRLHREEELAELRRGFDLAAQETSVHQHSTGSTAGDPVRPRKSILAAGKAITTHEASEIFSAMGYPDSLVDLSEGGVTRMASAATRAASMAGDATLLTFDDMISMLSHRREVRVKEQRCCAGFTEHELKDLKIVFDRYDTDASGVLSGKEVAPLLEQLGLSTGTVQDRERVLNEIDKARAMAKAAGVSDIGERGSGTMNFWELVQLLRLLYSHADSQVLERENRAIEETQFKRAEVDDFRLIFDDWLQKHKEFLEEARRIHDNQRIAKHPKLNSQDEDQHDALNADAIRRLISSLGLRMNTAQRGELEQKIGSFKTGGYINFPDFLRLMRWMLETDFAGLTRALGKDR
jgi:calmodulin